MARRWRIPGSPVLSQQRQYRNGEITRDKGPRQPLMERFEQSLSVAEREQFFPMGLGDPFAIQQLDWLRAIERGTDPETSGQEGLHDLAGAFAILESSALGRQVRVEEVLSGQVDAYQQAIDLHYGLL